MPARDLLLDEEPDHLALVGRLHLLGHDHLDPAVGARPSRAPRARPRPRCGRSRRSRRARLLGGLEQRVHRGRAVVRVVGVHVQVHVDEVAPRSRLRTAALPFGCGGARRRPRRGPRTRRRPGSTPARRARRRSGSRSRSASAGVATQPLELRRQRHRVARLEQQPELALVEHLLVLGEARGHRHGAPGQRAQQQLGGGAVPVEAATAMVGARRGAAPPSRRRGRRSARGRAAGAERRRRPAPPDRAARRSPASRARSGSLRSARRNSRSAPRSSSAENTISGGPSAALRAAGQVGAGPDHPVGAGEEALHHVARGGEAGGAPVEAPEQPLHERTRHLGRDERARWRSGRCPC